MAVGVFGDPCVESHSVYIYDRGGRKRVAQLLDVSQVRWSRIRDGVSEADVILQGSACSAQQKVLEAIEPKRSEMVIFRGLDRVWEGPVNRVNWHASYVEINARDVMDYLYGRPLSRTWDNSYPNNSTTTKRLESIVKHELTHQYVYSDDIGRPVVVPAWEAQNPPANVLPFFKVHKFDGEVKTSAKTKPYQMTVGEHIDNFARTGGIDYTIVGRGIHIWDTSNPLSTTRVLTEADFYGEIIVTAYGADHASVAFAVADDGRYGGAGGTPSDWKWLEKKTTDAGTDLKLPGDRDRRPSLVEKYETWNGHRYWMAYEPLSTKSRLRVVASKNLATWKDVSEVNVDAEAGEHVTTANWPALAFGWTQAHLWLFFIGTDGHLYRTRSTDGEKWTLKVDIYTPPAGVTLTSPSLYYNPVSKQWVFWAVNSQSKRLVYMTSTERLLDDNDHWGTLHTVNNMDGDPDLATVEMRRIAGKWIGLVTKTNGVTYTIESKKSTAADGFKIAPASAIPGGSNGKATWIFRPNSGQMSVLYGTGNVIKRTTMSGPAPDFKAGDKYMDYYGPWSKVFTVYDEDESHPPTQADLNGQARRNLQGRSPVPVEVRVPDNASIRLSNGITINTLVPGVYMPLRATLNSRQMTQTQKLDKVTVTETSDGEVIAVTLIPTTKPDVEVGGEDET